MSVALGETRILVLNEEPVFQDATLAILEMIEAVETRVVRTLSEAIAILIGENFDAFLVEGEAAISVEQAINARQHFPSLKIACLGSFVNAREAVAMAEQQD